MGEIKKPILEKLICGFIYKEAAAYEKAKKAMLARLGLIDFESKELDFNYTEYYAAEMGQGLKRRFLSFKKLIDPADIAGVKIFTDKIERKNLIPGTKNRMINIDPGLICHSKLVLATTKNFAHRVYLGKGIYAEVTMRYKAGKWTTHDWTYPDFASKEYMAILDEIRKIYKKQLEPAQKQA